MSKPELLIIPNTYYTPEEVAKLLRVSRRNVLRLLEEGAARGVRIGRQWRILGQDLLELPKSAAEPANHQLTAALGLPPPP
jgi:excisionase family DNA binding protein